MTAAQHGLIHVSTTTGDNGLLPNGLHDVLAPAAGHEASVTEALIGAFAGFGYDRVKPPLVEFESTLLDGGGALDAQMFRVMDPVSNRMMAVRTDMTLQVARIAATRLANAPRPLRLSYAGQVLRVSGTGLRPERQFTQAGVELFGANAVAADTEVAVLAATALRNVGVPRATIDLTSPAIVTAVLADADLSPADTATLHAALARKDIEVVGRFGDLAAPLSGMITAAGPADAAFAALAKLALPPAAATEVDRLAAVAAGLADAVPDVAVTVDPVEYRGFEYQTGVSFTLFAPAVRGELGRGGRYVTAAGEDATGFTLFLDSIMRAVPPPPAQRRVYLPFATPTAVARQLRDAGWVTVAGLAAGEDAAAAALAAGCSHALDGDQPRPVGATSGD